MNKDNYLTGIIFGITCVILVGLQPIIANSRPSLLDAFFFAATTCIIEAFLFLPLILIERRKFKKLKRPSNRNDNTNSEKLNSQLNGWKKNKILLIYVGINFGIAQVLFFLGYQLAGAINGALAQKTTVIFALLFGYLINHEKISKIQIIFSFILLFGLILAVTQGSFNLLEFNIGVILIVITAILWMLAHSLTKPILDKNEVTPTQIVFIRNVISGLFLFTAYFIIFPLNKLNLLFDPVNQFFILAMGITYGLGLFCWYQVLKRLGTSKATAMTGGTPIITIIFATIILTEPFTIFHVIGTLLVISSILVIIKPRKDDNS